LQLGEHSIDNQAQHDTNNAQILKTSSCPINCQSHYFEDATTDNFNDKQKFDSFSSKDLINLQKELRSQNNKNLIEPQNDHHSDNFDQQHNNDMLSDNSINTSDNGIILI